MSPMLATLEEVRSNVSLVASSASTDTTCQNSPGLQERNYMALSQCSSVESSVIPSPVDEKETKMNMKATELRLGLPGFQSPLRDQELSSLTSSKHDEKPLFPVVPLRKNVVSGNKRGFSDAMDGFSEVKAPAFTNANWIFTAVRSESEAAQSVAEGNFFLKTGAKNIPSSGPSPNSAVKPASIKDQAGPSAVLLKEIVAPKVSQEKMTSANDNGSAPASKALVVGWPPIRSFRKNTLANASKSPEEVDGNPGLGSLFVKVSMDGAPYLRKVDLKTYSTYLELSSALEKMFSFTVGQYETPGIRGRDMLSETKLKDLLHGSEYVLTYEDKDGDWMLVGDVPWEMFIDSCRRLRIVQGSDAIGLAPRAIDNCRNHN